MSVKNTLSILQYNVRNDRVSTMISLLTDVETQSYDIIAIQKSWRNSHVATSLSSHHSEFHLLYRFEADTRVCFYISDRINSDSWKIAYFTSNLCSLKIDTFIDSVKQTIHIHNVYNLSLIFYSSRDSLSILSSLALQLRTSEKHIILKDFNLHHFYWSDSTRLTQHVAADDLIDLINSAELMFTLSRDTITWKAREFESIIDLIFMFENMTSRLEHCKSRADMKQSFDHVSIFIRLDLDFDSTLVIKRRAWKLLNMKKLRDVEKQASKSRTSRDESEIDNYVVEI